MLPHIIPRLGLDLGTGKTVLATVGRICYNEPTVMVADAKNNRVTYTGKEAAERVGKLGTGYDIVRPVMRGAIADYAATKFYLRRVFSHGMRPPRMLRPMIVAAVPIELNSVEERALCDAGREAGAGQIYLVPCNLASYVGIAGNLNDPRGSLVVDIGAGTTNISVLASNEIIVGKTLQIGGDDLSATIHRVMEMTFGVLCGREDAVKAKIEAGVDKTNEGNMLIKRKHESGESGFKEVRIPFSSLAEFNRQAIEPILDGVVEVLEQTPPELYEDIFFRGMFLTGGTARLKGLEPYLEEKLQMKINMIENPELSVIHGLRKILAEFKEFKEFFKHHVTF